MNRHTIVALSSSLIALQIGTGCSNAEEGTKGDVPGNGGGSGASPPGSGGNDGGSGGAFPATGGLGGNDGGSGGTFPATGGLGGNDGGSGGTPATGGLGGEGGTSTGGALNDPLENDWGFDFRLPEERVLFCEDPEDISDGDWQVTDRNWLCSFSDGTKIGVLYFQGVASECFVMMSPQVVYQSGVAQIYIDGVLSPLSDASYDWGGNHHNDALSFSYDGVSYQYFHSSFNAGYRSCQHMDCARIRDADGIIVEDGCTCDRSRPIVCVLQNVDGSFPELEDSFEICPYDSDCEE